MDFSSQKPSYKLSADKFLGLHYLYLCIICSNTTQEGKKTGGGRLPPVKPGSSFVLPSSLYFSDITILTELRTTISHNFTYLQHTLKP